MKKAKLILILTLIGFAIFGMMKASTVTPPTKTTTKTIKSGALN